MVKKAKQEYGQGHENCGDTQSVAQPVDRVLVASRVARNPFLAGKSSKHNDKNHTLPGSFRSRSRLSGRRRLPLPFAVLLAEFALQKFARGGVRQFIDKHDGIGQLPFRETLREEGR